MILTQVDNIGYNLITAIHLDPVGGVAGDMFVAAMVNALPGLWPDCARAVEAVDPPTGLTASVIDFTDGVLCGARFEVSGTNDADSSSGHTHHHHHHDHHHDHHHSADGHGHTRWSDIRDRLQRAPLTPGVKQVALEIFSRLAKAEATVHGLAVDDVMFHEVGAWDSIVDIVASAVIIDRLSHCSWSTGALPRGNGLVRTAHGMLPVPAPATVELLKGYVFFDDGDDGERVTPTGAAILNYLAPSQASASHQPARLLDSGNGFGTKKLHRRSNILRAMLYTEIADQRDSDWIEVLRCEVDDQTPEDFATALDRLRQADGVLDVCYWSASSKKGRVAMALQVLAAPDKADDVCRLLFDQTTTLGIRRVTTRRDKLQRMTMTTSDGVRIKLAERPSGLTAKAEADDLSENLTRAERERVRILAEQQALRGVRDDE